MCWGWFRKCSRGKTTLTRRDRAGQIFGTQTLPRGPHFPNEVFYYVRCNFRESLMQICDPYFTSCKKTWSTWEPKLKYSKCTDNFAALVDTRLHCFVFLDALLLDILLASGVKYCRTATWSVINLPRIDSTIGNILFPPNRQRVHIWEKLMDITNIPSLENVGEFMPAWLYFILSKRLGQGTWNVQTQRTVFGEKTPRPTGAGGARCEWEISWFCMRLLDDEIVF